MSLDRYWAQYAEALARVRAEKPDSFAAVKAILDAFQQTEGEQAFFPGGADDTLGDAVEDAGWTVAWEEGDYLWNAHHPHTGSLIRYVEGDVYEAHERWTDAPFGTQTTS